MLTAAACLLCCAADAVPVRVTMNSVSTTMSLKSCQSGETIQVGTPVERVYDFDIPAGEYILSAYATDGTTVNGTIVLDISDTAALQSFPILTHTIWSTNKNTDGTTWRWGDDYTVDCKIVSVDGDRETVTVGSSVEDNRVTVLSKSGNSIYFEFMPSRLHEDEGYMPVNKSVTVTGNTEHKVEFTIGYDYVVTVPRDAALELGTKGAHFTDFSIVQPTAVKEKGSHKEITYRLTKGLKYNIRTWRNDGVTQALYFTKLDKTESLTITDDDYDAYDPHRVNHTVDSNGGYETGDIFVNINERNHLVMNIGDTFDAHAMRTWQLTDNATGNYFFEPDFHYKVIGLDGKPSSGVIEISTDDTSSSWRTINAIGRGTAIVLVTYDAMCVGYMNGTEKKDYLGGRCWGAIWPENTAVYVVTVGETLPALKPNMVVNSAHNKETLKLAGNNVDAEHDVFYYLDSEEGYRYTFSPEGVDNVTVAYPSVTGHGVTYSGFSSEGVSANEDGSYTVLLKEGRQIVRLSDANGNSIYQVMTAKPCQREIMNLSRPGSTIFMPGDKVAVKFSGLFHPANKLAGIYNMSAFVMYNGTPNGKEVIGTRNQYMFGSTPKAQTIEIQIPDNYDAGNAPVYSLGEGMIQVSGFGDPIGNHRNISRTAGRSPNFNAQAHATCFGAIPDTHIDISAYRTFPIRIDCDQENAEIEVSFQGKKLTAGDDGMYNGTLGEYNVVAKCKGFRCLREKYSIPDDAEGTQVFEVNLVPDAKSWDGKTLTEPACEDGVYYISDGSELAWFADHVKENADSHAVLTDDIQLGNYEWNPIGNTFGGTFDGRGHTIDGLYVNTKVNYPALFAMVVGKSDAPAEIKNLTVRGYINTTSTLSWGGGIASQLGAYAAVDRCVNEAEVHSPKNYAGGITGWVKDATAVVSNCINRGRVVGTGSTYTGGLVGMIAVDATLKNSFSTGEVEAAKANYNGSCIGKGTSVNVTDVFSTMSYKDSDKPCLVTSGQMASGEIAWRLGAAFGQSIGTDCYPVLNGVRVYRVTYTVVGDTPAADADNALAIYTNGQLPSQLDGENLYWYSDSQLSHPVTTVESDATLYVKTGQPAGIGYITSDDNTDIRWYSIDGIEVGAPRPGQHGLYIKVTDGNAVKVIL